MKKSERNKTTRRNPHIGSSLDKFLKEDGLYDEVVALAAKKKIARQLRETMERRDMSISSLARELRTSRNQVHRILDPQDHNVTLATLEKAAAVVGCKVKLELVKS
jgi:antitoxin HicB